MDLAEYKRTKAAVEEAQKEHDRSQGALQEVRRSIKKKFKVRNLKELEELYKQKQEAEAKAEMRFESAYAKFNKSYRHALAIHGSQ